MESGGDYEKKRAEVQLEVQRRVEIINMLGEVGTMVWQVDYDEETNYIRGED